MRVYSLPPARYHELCRITPRAPFDTREQASAFARTCFVFGHRPSKAVPTPMGDNGLFFPTHFAAIQAANRQGLQVDPKTHKVSVKEAT